MYAETPNPNRGLRLRCYHQKHVNEQSCWSRAPSCRRFGLGVSAYMTFVHSFAELMATRAPEATSKALCCVFPGFCLIHQNASHRFHSPAGRWN